MNIQKLIQRPGFWVAVVILLHILVGLLFYLYRPAMTSKPQKPKRTFTPLAMQKMQRVQPPKGNSLTQKSAQPASQQGAQRPQQTSQMNQPKPSLPAQQQEGSSNPIQQAAAPTKAPKEHLQPDQTIKRDKGIPTQRKKIQAPKQAKRKTVKYYPDTPQPREASPLAAIAQGFMNYQQNQQHQQQLGTADGSKFGDLKHMKYVGYWKRFQQHFNVSWRIIYNELPRTEMMQVSGRQTYKNVTYHLTWDTTGKILKSACTESSGNDVFDAAVARLIKEATPVPAIPISFKVKTMSINFSIGPGVVQDSIPTSFGYT